MSLVVTVTDPAQQNEGMNKFTSYKVNTQVNATHPNFPFQSSAVVRRYSDFVWLVDQLMKEYAGAVVPPIPEKQAVSRFSPEFVEGRRKMLEQFLVRVCAHPELVNARALSSFLSADDVAFSVAKNKKSSEGETQKGGGMMKWFQETKTSLSKDLVKCDDDEEFAQINQYMESLESQMKVVVKHTQSLVKKGRETATGLFEFGLAFTLLGQSEDDDLGGALTQVGHTADSLSVLSTTQAEMECKQFESPLVDYIRLIGSVKAALKQRENKLVSFSAATADVASKKASLTKVQGVAGKEDKVVSAEAALAASEEALAASSDDFKVCSSRCLREVARFKEEKAVDMRKTVLDYINLQIEYNKKMEETWTNLVPQLEGVNVSSVGNGFVGAGNDQDRVRSTSELKGGAPAPGGDDGLVGV
ncbi:hypothetical protein TrRE_jg5157 [Triparma retinervis]|uniref:PX domain-containing protein n=1 Tax=Triparma retinervis TaxID=2557542 RepID=A0A9W7L4P0_9STRA|nr:hypothetical protein TrRE_jg5157 [Triparma retinervis]